MSEIRATTISDLTGTGPATLTGQSAAKAWAGITYSAGTPSVAQSLNVSSITDNGTGFIVVNHSSNFNAGNYGVGTAGSPSTNNDAAVNADRRNVDFLSAQFYENATSATDPNYFGFSADGDLA